MSHYPIYDLHCDLLWYLNSKKERTFNDREVRCSRPQLKEGRVELQTLAIFSETGDHSVAQGEGQLSIYSELAKSGALGVSTLIAIENASILGGEKESLQQVLARLDDFYERGGPILYVSLTWNDENRFGGGNFSSVGLKRDGEILLEHLAEKNIAIDFSHTSDRLAYDLFNYIDKESLQITPIASHSNFRAVCDVPRNLPDPIAKEIIRRGGIIGINFVRRFVGEAPDAFKRHIEHARSLGGLDHLCVGSDFYFEGDLPPSLQYLKPSFFAEFDNSSTLPTFVEFLTGTLNAQEKEKVAFKNAERFLTERGLHPVCC